MNIGVGPEIALERLRRLGARPKLAGRGPAALLDQRTVMLDDLACGLDTLGVDRPLRLGQAGPSRVHRTKRRLGVRTGPRSRHDRLSLVRDWSLRPVVLARRKRQQ